MPTDTKNLEMLLFLRFTKQYHQYDARPVLLLVVAVLCLSVDIDVNASLSVCTFLSNLWRVGISCNCTVYRCLSYRRPLARFPCLWFGSRCQSEGDARGDGHAVVAWIGKKHQHLNHGDLCFGPRNFKLVFRQCVFSLSIFACLFRASPFQAQIRDHKTHTAPPPTLLYDACLDT